MDYADRAVWIHPTLDRLMDTHPIPREFVPPCSGRWLGDHAAAPGQRNFGVLPKRNDIRLARVSNLARDASNN